MTAESTGKQLALRAQEISRGTSLHKLPKPEELAKMSPEQRHEVQEGLRIELYALASLLADAAVVRARRLRDDFPPYGLVRSRHTELRMVVANPDPVLAGEIDGFLGLGKAYVDTTVWHLHGSFAELREQGRGWMIDRLDDLLKVFKVGASQTSRARMRDAPSFIYGGLHFGTSVCVQLVEVMASLLAVEPDGSGGNMQSAMSAEEKASVMTRSSKPAYDLAGYSVAGIVKVYGALQSTTRKSVAGKSVQGWLDPDRFVLRGLEGRPWRIDLRDAPEPSEVEGPADLHSFTPLGCPARISPSGATSAIATLWSWCVELAHDTGLLGEPAPKKPPTPPMAAPVPATAVPEAAEAPKPAVADAGPTDQSLPLARVPADEAPVADTSISRAVETPEPVVAPEVPPVDEAAPEAESAQAGVDSPEAAPDPEAPAGC